MQKKALIVIDIQNDMTKNYKDIIASINKAIDWAVTNHIHVVYMKHYNLSEKTRTFKPNTYGSELTSDLNIVSDHVFTKSKGNILTSEQFTDFIHEYEVDEFYITGGDAIACVKSSVHNLIKEQYKVHVLSDCITSYDKKKLPEMLTYYEKKGCTLIRLCELLDS